MRHIFRWSYRWTHKQLPPGEIPSSSTTTRRKELPRLLPPAPGSPGARNKKAQAHQIHRRLQVHFLSCKAEILIFLLDGVLRVNKIRTQERYRGLNFLFRYISYLLHSLYTDLKSNNSDIFIFNFIMENYIYTLYTYIYIFGMSVCI